ncbi:MAG: carboxylating nicotinate-nucleotide diphosphorylase [Candidatus Brocadiia bacterium]
MDWEAYDWLLDAALSEDAAERDATTRALIAEGRTARGDVRARVEGVICGLPLAARLASRLDPELRLQPVVADGDRVSGGTVVARLSGPARSLLAVERPMLNLLQRLSGVATLTARFVEAVAGTGTGVYDTRKTTPGWRALEKYAVRCGGGRNHRMDLASAVLIKDNHLALMGTGSVGRAVEQARAECPDLPIEVEVENLEQLEAALAAGPDIVLLDNMTPARVEEAAEMARRAGGNRPQLEASGAITLENAADYARAGADRIAVGALTHSAPALDISVEIVG